MGRSSKFTFPVPGRKSKKDPPPLIISPPLASKAQKFLGTSQISIDDLQSPRSPWETRSVSNASGISITVSDSTATNTSVGRTGLGIVNDGQGVVNGAAIDGGRRLRWEDESAVIPPLSIRRPSHGTLGEESFTDASSIRRRQSGSTITSFYDKSKLPLSISQQTSNSAMAKGLPAKASALLDIEGSSPATAPMQKKKKPARLDLSHLLLRPRSSRQIDPQLVKGMVLGSDMIVRSPSIMSVSPDAAVPPAIQQRTTGIRRKLTKESLRDQARPGSRPGTGASERELNTSDSEAGLRNLYEHYEQISFQDIEEEAEEEEVVVEQFPVPGRRITDYATPPSTSSTRGGYLSPFDHPTSRGPLASSRGSIQSPDTPITAVLTTPSVTSPVADCSASISSRHTRTSKASKRTQMSLVSSDLQLNSILSLSSDSEGDEYESPPKTSTSLSVPRRPSTGNSASPTSDRPAFAHEWPVPPSRDDRPRGKDMAMHARQIVEPSASPAAHPAAIHSRTSSGGISPKTLEKRVAKPPVQPDLTTNISRAIAMVPTVQQTARQVRTVSQQFVPPRTSSRMSRASEQPTPPLSPTSVDFYLQSQHTSLNLDNASLRSGKSFGTVGSATAPVTDGSGRFMAVTRQEEMLLAALRNKRARMRENIIAEFEEEQGFQQFQDRSSSRQSSRQSRHSRLPSQDMLMATALAPLAESHQATRPRAPSSGSQTRNRVPPATISQKSSQSTIVGAGHSNSFLSVPVRNVVKKVDSDGTLGPSRSTAGSAHSDDSARILLYIDRPADKVDTFDTSEPSPDLSDFMDFDDGTTSGLSEDFPFPRSSSDGGSNMSSDLPGITDDSASGSISAPGSGSGSSSARRRHAETRGALRPSAVPQELTAVQRVDTFGQHNTARHRQQQDPKTPPYSRPRPDSNPLSTKSGSLFRPARASSSSRSHSRGQTAADDVHVRIVDDSFSLPISGGHSGMGIIGEEEEVAGAAGIPRPDSPMLNAVSSPTFSPPMSATVIKAKRKQARLSAVGGMQLRPMVEAGWWDDDG